jgi:L-2-hydroxyglutarate oxidase LhgO
MDADITIIGAGVIGLAIAQKVSETYKNVFVVEKNKTFGQETSSRNSEVVHAGIYYPEGSLKAKLCMEGNSLLYDYCTDKEIPFNKCGKLIVATNNDEVKAIEGIRETAEKNGVGLILMEKDQIQELEPNIFAIKALYSPTTGIVDTHSLMKQFETNTINNGGLFAYGSEVTGIKKIKGGYKLSLHDVNNTDFSFTSRLLINSTGLSSDKIAGMAGMNDSTLAIRFCKGEYFKVSPPKNRLINRLIYPVPHTNMEGIGIHVTVDMTGGVKLGPDVQYLESNIYDFTVSQHKQEAFWLSAKKFLPFLEFDDLSPEMAGIRPKIQGPGEPIRDFYIAEESERGLEGLINLIGMESPGLTSCLSIANYVNKIIHGLK